MSAPLRPTLTVASRTTVSPGSAAARVDQLVRALPDLIHVAQAASTMLGRMIRDEGAREGITNGEVWAKVRRALLLHAGG